MFHLVASTGRTATSLIAEALDGIGPIAACHEGHRANDEGTDLLPLVNLDNFAAYKDAQQARLIAASKRGSEQVDAALDRAITVAGRPSVLVDVAYYNSVIGRAVLDLHPESRLVGVVRDCVGFVRSVTWLHGEDPMPVGWPAPDKPLSPRERFIALGRVRPVEGPDVAAWGSWGPIERNIWLWRATNRRLLDIRDAHPERVVVLDFAHLPPDPGGFLRRIVEALAIEVGPQPWDRLAQEASGRGNARLGGYQIGPIEGWTCEQRKLLGTATAEIDERFPHVHH